MSIYDTNNNKRNLDLALNGVIERLDHLMAVRKSSTRFKEEIEILETNLLIIRDQMRYVPSVLFDQQMIFKFSFALDAVKRWGEKAKNAREFRADTLKTIQSILSIASSISKLVNGY